MIFIKLKKSMNNFIKILLVLIIVFGTDSCKLQSLSEKKLIGKWVLVEETGFLENENTLVISENKSIPESKVKLKTILTFTNDNKIFVNQEGYKYNANYKLKDSILTLGNRKYIIIEVSEKRLIYKEKDEIFDNKYVYKKMNNI